MHLNREINRIFAASLWLLFETMRPLLINTRRFPLHDYRAITLFPFVFYKGEPLTDRELRHETIHLYQQLFLLIVPFYLLYLLFWLFALLRHRNWYRAYRAIPFERSAYRLESQPLIPVKTMAFHWLRCIR